MYLNILRTNKSLNLFEIFIYSHAYTREEITHRLQIFNLFLRKGTSTNYFFLNTNCVTVFPVCPPNWNVSVGSCLSNSKSANNNCIFALLCYRNFATKFSINKNVWNAFNEIVKEIAIETYISKFLNDLKQREIFLQIILTIRKVPQQLFFRPITRS